jgi:hypothetical protein
MMTAAPPDEDPTAISPGWITPEKKGSKLWAN